MYQRALAFSWNRGLIAALLVTLLIGACGPATSSAPSTAQTAQQPDQGSQPPPLSEWGPYSPGRRIYTIQDPQRQNRQVRFTVWYPATLPRGDTTPVPQDAKTNKKGAPYPLILCAAKDGRIFAPHLVSHGFVVAGVEGIDTYERWDRNLIDQPLDILFMLRQIGGELLEGLKGMIDAERAGAMGYSFDGYNALALSGVRVDPQFYLDRCAHVQDMEPPLGTWQIYYLCEMAPEWDEMVALAGSTITASDDGLWQPLTDPRIRAAMPMAPEGLGYSGSGGWRRSIAQR